MHCGSLERMGTPRKRTLSRGMSEDESLRHIIKEVRVRQKSFHCHCSQCCHLQPLVILLCKLYLPSLVSILPLANLPELNQYEPSQQSKRVADVRALVKTWAITQYKTVGTVYSQYNWFSFASNTMVHIVVTDDKIWLMKQILDNRRGNNHSVILFFV